MDLGERTHYLGSIQIQRLLAKMEAKVNTLCLQAQLQQKLQLNYRTNIAQICQKIKLYGSPTTKD